MSRVGKQPVQVPSGAKVTIADRRVTVEGPKGTLSIEHAPCVSVAWDESERWVVVSVANAGDRRQKALWGTTRALIANMIKGVVDGYEVKLEVVGVGWGIQAQGQKLSVSVGFASPRVLEIPAGVSVAVEKQNVTLSSADKQAVTQFAAQIRSIKKPEPYQGKGIKYAGEVIRRKPTKQFGS